MLCGCGIISRKSYCMNKRNLKFVFVETKVSNIKPIRNKFNKEK